MGFLMTGSVKQCSWLPPEGSVIKVDVVWDGVRTTDVHLKPKTLRTKGLNVEVLEIRKKNH